jgi:uncharacterized protein (DUF1499 family)
MKIGSISGLMTMFIMGSVSGAGMERLGATEDRLAPCPDSPNCVSTQSESKRHAMAPLPYLQTREASRERILSILRGMKRRILHPCGIQNRTLGVCGRCGISLR